ncbi:MAG: hypothetical protein LBM60_06320 [Clostridium sp.]|jgi:predicted small lipoprotein YifL|nr:hypothetical protein [Clostridium sp.]
MKKILVLILALLMTLSLAACGNKDTDNKPNGGNNATPSSSQGGNDTPTPSSPGGNDNDTPDDGNDSGLEIGVADESTPILDAIGKTEEGKRMVVQLVGESYSLRVAPEGTKALYHSYEFDEEGVLDSGTSKYWYVFEDAASYNAALTDWLDANPEFWLYNRSSSELYYAVYVLPAIRDEDGDGSVTWYDAWYDWENWVNHDQNILIE